MTNFGLKSQIGFIGAGSVGGSLAISLSNNNYSIVATSSRTFNSAQELAHRIIGCVSYEKHEEVARVSDVVFITTPDDAIESVVSKMTWRPNQGVVHCSGVASLDVLKHADNQGALTGSFHPLQAFSSIDSGVKSIPGITFGIEGTPKIKTFLKNMAVNIRGNPIFLTSQNKPLYHLSAVMMGNLLTVLGAVSGQLWENIGLTRSEGIKALIPIMKQVSINLESLVIPEAFAGPYVRGDIGTIQKHLETLQIQEPSVLPLYCELALAGLPFAIEKGTLTQDRAETIRQTLLNFKNTRNIQ